MMAEGKIVPVRRDSDGGASLPGRHAAGPGRDGSGPSRDRLEYNILMPETLTGSIEQVVFHNPDNGFAVLRVQPAGRGNPVTVVGHLAVAISGEFIEAEGSWVQDREHGKQFRADRLQATPPHTVAGIEKFLASGLIKGIGPHYASRIVAAFGERTLSVIDESPSFLKEVKGIGPRRLERIRHSWQEQKAVRRIMVFLQEHGVGTARAIRIWKTYGDRAIDLIRENPYRLAADIWGVGFRTADALAQRMGIDRHSPLRARAAILHVLQELSSQGHVGFPEARVIEETVNRTDTDAALLPAVIDACCSDAEVVRERFAVTLPSPGTQAGVIRPLPPGGESRSEGELEPWLYLNRLHRAEVGVASVLRRLGEGAHPLPRINLDIALVWVENRMGLQLADTQRDAIRQAATRKVLVITGGPGVGKTTIVRGILDIFTAKGMRCALAAPTGRAAKRLAETTRTEAKTIHRLLEFDPGRGQFSRGPDEPLEHDLIIVDEMSMVDIVLMHQFLRAVPPTASLVLVGDADQLPSVGPGNVLRDIIASGAVPVVRLSEIFRQAGQSWIVRAAHQVNRGELPTSAPPGQGDFYFVEASSTEAVLDRMIAMIRDRIPARFGLDPLRDVQVLTPMNRSDLGVRALNDRLQEIFNPRAGGPEAKQGGWTFRVGDKVIQTVNDYQKEVYNGDIGRVAAIDPEDQEVTANFDGRSVVYDFGELDELALAYALTIHKSQGSEYPAVVVPLQMAHYLLLQRNLLYTAITRGKKLVVLVGSKKALAVAVQRQDTSHRCSALEWRLQTG
jgi:exodeoxyribonuclease V alpha subunit